jgi:hypothetical protein
LQEFKRLHINQAYNLRLSTNGRVLADYSQSSYNRTWTQDCWWGVPVIVYGGAGEAGTRHGMQPGFVHAIHGNRQDARASVRYRKVVAGLRLVTVTVPGPVAHAGLSKEHPVIAFLAAEGRCSQLSYYKDG